MSESDVVSKLHQTTNARVWAQEFCDRFQVTAKPRRVAVDDPEGLMIGWFANAIEVGRSAGQRTDDYGRVGDLVRVGSAAFEDEAQKRQASINRISSEKSVSPLEDSPSAGDPS